jgi:hypothetical protein
MAHQLFWVLAEALLEQLLVILRVVPAFLFLDLQTVINLILLGKTGPAHKLQLVGKWTPNPEVYVFLLEKKLSVKCHVLEPLHASTLLNAGFDLRVIANLNQNVFDLRLRQLMFKAVVFEVQLEGAAQISHQHLVHLLFALAHLEGVLLVAKQAVALFGVVRAHHLGELKLHGFDCVTAVDD